MRVTARRTAFSALFALGLFGSACGARPAPSSPSPHTTASAAAQPSAPDPPLPDSGPGAATPSSCPAAALAKCPPATEAIARLDRARCLGSAGACFAAVELAKEARKDFVLRHDATLEQRADDTLVALYQGCPVITLFSGQAWKGKATIDGRPAGVWSHEVDPFHNMVDAGEHDVRVEDARGRRSDHIVVCARPGAGIELSVDARTFTIRDRATPSAPATPEGGLATPGPAALPCTGDAVCGMHRCNTIYGKCAFPCATAKDCAGSSECAGGVCRTR